MSVFLIQYFILISRCPILRMSLARKTQCVQETNCKEWSPATYHWQLLLILQMDLDQLQHLLHLQKNCGNVTVTQLKPATCDLVEVSPDIVVQTLSPPPHLVDMLHLEKAANSTGEITDLTLTICQRESSNSQVSSSNVFALAHF